MAIYNNLSSANKQKPLPTKKIVELDSQIDNVAEDFSYENTGTELSKSKSLEDDFSIDDIDSKEK